jgi:hypothetical protein
MRYLHLLAFAGLTVFTSAVYADINNCSSGDVHCAYSTNPANPANYYQGNYIRVSATGLGTTIACLPYGASISIDQTDVQTHNLPAKNIWTIEECSDAQCKNAITIGIDSFTLTKTSQGYSATPNTYAFTIGHYPAVTCPFATTQAQFK